MVKKLVSLEWRLGSVYDSKFLVHLDQEDKIL
jgi:hypothetical protein